MGAPVEQARIDPNNVEILIQHLKCAAFELPFARGESFGEVPPDSVNDAMEFLSEHRVVHPSESASGEKTYHWASEAYPANHVSLRSVGWDNYVIINLGARHNLVPNVELKVARDSEFVCKVYVSRVLDDHSVCEILPTLRQGTVVEGDRVIQ